MLVNYAAAQARTRMRVAGLDASRQVAFDFEHVSKTPCISSWNAVTLRLNGLRIE
jgi:arylsulfate sulfotransferase